MSETQNPSPGRGLICRQCGCRHFYVTHTERLARGLIRRRRVCRHCGRRLVTFEGAATIIRKPNRQM